MVVLVRALVIGAARSGLAISRLLQKKGYSVVLTDLKKINEKEELTNLGIQVFDLGHPDSLLEQSFDLVVKNPGISHHNEFVLHFAQKQFIYNEIEVALQYAPYFEVGAITGTNGKTTITAALGAILKAESENNLMGGNIGIPMSELVDHYGHQSAKVSCEIAAFQLIGCQQFKPKVAVITNLSPDHLDVFTSIDEYYQAKCRIFANMDKSDVFLRNRDDAEVVARTQNLPCQVIDFSLTESCDLTVEQGWVVLNDEKLFEVSDILIVGQHNLINLMIASAMARIMKVEIPIIRHAIQQFEGVEHRIEKVIQKDGVTYYNDSKATNCDATIVALKSFDQPVILLAGGYDKKTGFDELIPYLHKVSSMIVFGDTKMQLKAIYPQAIVCENINEAVAMAKKIATYDDVILFSPACASYDQFDNYEQRGQIYKKLVLTEE